jgi:hypothetical protein
MSTIRLFLPSSGHWTCANPMNSCIIFVIAFPIKTEGLCSRLAQEHKHQTLVITLTCFPV